MSIMMRLIIFFKDCRAALTLKVFSHMGRIIVRSKWLDIHTKDQSKSWASGFFFVNKDWNLLDKWIKLKESLIPLYVE
ncbi:hypothetical protein IEQ34_015808 [Dendrobium chrysotoxum]|uniref:Uncharacterized protein n=1 Tax=Dendrobium chrysotoxum TaxID=161865 RepID=A0AAV7GGV2_DENCH|nr:hypothetical protein IEQ34_015808 [Dendrobium chrysotoxum]